MELKLNKPIPEDTICAISTAPGMGGIAVIRISGTNAIIITDRIFHTANKKKLSEAKPNTAHYGTIADENETPIDDVVVTLFIAPHSFTGEDTVENLSCYGKNYSHSPRSSNSNLISAKKK